MRILARFLLVLVALPFSICRAQTAIPNSLPALNYPPIARAARVQGDVVVSFRRQTDGSTADVSPISGPAMLQAVAVENVKAWHFNSSPKPDTQSQKVTFHFRLIPPESGFDDDGQSKIQVELDGVGGIQVLSVLTTGLGRSECPSLTEREPPPAVIDGDFVEVQRWNEVVRIGSDGVVRWEFRKTSRTGQVSPAEAKALLDRFRTRTVWGLCGSYQQGGLMDGGGSSFSVRVGGREKRVSEYGDVAPPIFEEVELAVDAVANTHQWRHGDPITESIVEITDEYLPKPGKTKLMDAVHRGDKAGFLAALAAGDKLTDVDASGWTPLMYAASSYGDSPLKEIINAGVDVNARSKRGETALMASAVMGMADEDLLEAHADVNAVNDVGMTAIMLLAQRAEPDEISTLIKAGGDARKKDATGRTALDYLNAANCGSPILESKDPRWWTSGYSKCNALDADDYRKSKRLLLDAGAKATRIATPRRLEIQENK